MNINDFSRYLMENNSTANSTHVRDLYCTELFVGPLVWAVFTAPCACVGVPASVWLLWVLIQRQRSGLSNDVYMLNLTIMDLIFNAYIILDILNFFVWKVDVLLHVAFVVQYFSVCGRLLFMASVCVDCYMAVVHPVMYMTLKHSRFRMVTCAVIWAFTLGWGMQFVLCDNYVPVILSPIPSCIAILLIALCDITIFCFLRKPDPSGRSDIHPLKKRVLQVLIDSLVMTVVSFFVPMVLEFALSLSLSPEEIKCSLSYPVMIFSTLGSTILPLLHLGNLGNLKSLSGCGCGTNNT
ncbi:proteinase-activated receptor 3-like [Sardina pilchardus]|uniref:proteinase-activated receptor 3-like n=1 Tax=Sardina pilchardus TaxID=27697 RepID=UPI002E164D91